MKRKFYCLTSLVVVLGLLLSACNTSTPAPDPTATPEPTSTPVPTPTATPEPAGFIEQGMQLLFSSDIEGAREALDQALTWGPEDASAHAAMSWFLLSTTDWDTKPALDQARIAVELDPENVAAQTVLARILFNLEKYDEATEAIDKALALEPENARALAVKAFIKLYTNDFEAAFETIEQAYTLAPEDAYVLRALAMIYYETADYPRMYAVLQEMLALYPDYFVVHAKLASFWLDAGDPDKALPYAEKALELSQDNTGAMLQLGDIALSQHDYETAESWYEKAGEVSPDNPQVSMAYAYMHNAKGDMDEAISFAQEAIERNPDDLSLHWSLGFFYTMNDECGLAENEMQVLIEDDAESVSALTGMAVAKLCDGDIAKALDYLRKAEDITPYSRYVYAQMANAYDQQDRLDKAKEANVNAMRVAMNPTGSHIAMGFLAYMEGDVDGAKAQYEKAVEVDPYNATALILQAQILADEGNSEEALAMMREAFALNSEDDYIRAAMGHMEVLYDDVDTGVKLLEATLEEEPDDAYTLRALGVGYIKQGKYQEAREQLESYQSLTNSSDADLLLEAAISGFDLSVDKAFKDLITYFEDFVDMEVTVEATGEDSARKVVVEIKLDPEDLDDENSYDLNYMMSLAMAISAMQLPQVSPPVPGGVEIRMTLYGDAKYIIKLDVDDIETFFYGQNDFETLFTSAHITKLIDSKEATLREIENRLEELRELEFEYSVPSENITMEEYRAELEGDDEDYTEEELAEEETFIAGEEAMLELLGLVDEDFDLEQTMIDVQTASVAGYYVPSEDKFYILGDDEEQTTEDETTIAHEYTHALQDQHFDLETIFSDELNDDESIAYRSLAEGDATLMTIFYAEEYILATDMMALLSSSSGYDTDVMDNSPDFVEDTMTFPYFAGLEFVYTLYERGGWDEVNEAFENPPVSTEQILHPERYYEGDEPILVPLGDLAKSLGDDWVEIDEDVMGELGFSLTLAEHAGPVAAAQAADGWGGDRYRILYNEADDTYAVALASRWDDEDEAEDFFGVVKSMMWQRKEFTQVIDSLIGEITDFWWESDNSAMYAAMDGDKVVIVVAEDMVTLTEVVEVME